MINHMKPFTKWLHLSSSFVEKVRYRVLRIMCRFMTKRKVNRTVNSVGRYPIKLHLGCGGYIMDGWVNCDLSHRSKKVLRIDLLREFPFPDSCVNFAYAEHVLEHFSIDEVRIILKHLFRVMQCGGVFRIAQPDLQAMIQDSLFSTDWTRKKNLYSATKEKDLPTGTHYLNFIWDAWGHKFNHSYESLKHELELAGFRNVTECLALWYLP